MPDMTKAALMCIICCVTTTSVRVAADPLPAIDPVDINSLAGEAWYRAKLMGSPVGYLHTDASIVDVDGAPRLQTVEEMALRIDFGQGGTDVTAFTTVRYGEDLRPEYQRSDQNEFGRPKVIEAWREGQELRVKTVAGEVEREKRLPLADNFGSELLLSVASSQGKLPDHGEYAFQSFVPELEMLVDFIVTCEGREPIEVDGETVDALKIVFAASAIGLEMNWWVDGQGEMVRQAIPSMMNLELERVTEEEARGALASFALSDHIPVEARLGATRSLKQVTLSANSTGTPAAELVPDGPLQTVEATGDTTATIVVNAETDEGLEGHTLPFEGPHFAEYLGATDIIQSDHPAIVEKAREIAGDETDAWAAAQLLVRWVHDNMAKVDHDPRPVTALECLRMMAGDCSEHSTLLCALARAVGIPSKFVTGIIYMDNGKERGYYYHAWNELYIGRWVTVDATWNETLANAGHLQLAAGSLTSESFAQTNLSAVRCMGVLELEVTDHQTK